MSTELFTALVAFSVVMFFTPGPNNIMLMTSGLNFGFARTRPHLFGVSLGFGAMALCVGLGLGTVFKAYPVLHVVLKVVGSVYLLYLAWRIATAGQVNDAASKSAPLTFVQAAAFQWVNPKAWLIAVSAMATYVSSSGFPFNVALIAVTFASIGTVSAGAWAMFGTKLRTFLKTQAALRLFNIAMALLLVASLYPLFAEALQYLKILAQKAPIT